MTWGYSAPILHSSVETKNMVEVLEGYEFMGRNAKWPRWLFDGAVRRLSLGDLAQFGGPGEGREGVRAKLCSAARYRGLVPHSRIELPEKSVAAGAAGEAMLVFQAVAGVPGVAKEGVQG